MPTTLASARSPLCTPDLCLARSQQRHVAVSTECGWELVCPRVHGAQALRKTTKRLREGADETAQGDPAFTGVLFLFLLYCCYTIFSIYSL